MVTLTREQLIERIEQRTKRETIVQELGECWVWDKAQCGGYGRIKNRNRRYLVHRLSYEIFVGPIPEGLDVLHKCDVRLCCNPRHLYPGTDQDNCNDKRERGQLPIGSMVGVSKLTEPEVFSMRVAFSQGSTEAELEQLYSVSNATVRSVVYGDQWKHVGGPIAKKTRIYSGPPGKKTWEYSN